MLGGTAVGKAGKFHGVFVEGSVNGPGNIGIGINDGWGGRAVAHGINSCGRAGC